MTLKIIFQNFRRREAKPFVSKSALFFLVILAFTWSPSAGSVTAYYYVQAALDHSGAIYINAKIKKKTCVPFMTFSEPVEKVDVYNTYSGQLILELRAASYEDCFWGLSTYNDFSKNEELYLEKGQIHKQHSIEFFMVSQCYQFVTLSKDNAFGTDCHGQIEITVENTSGEIGTFLYASEYHPPRGGCS